jgi:hypothetical protein
VRAVDGCLVDFWGSTMLNCAGGGGGGLKYWLCSG